MFVKYFKAVTVRGVDDYGNFYVPTNLGAHYYFFNSGMVV